jgi:hypothetical protein
MAKPAKREKEDNQDARRIVTPTFKASFPHLFKPSAIKGGEPKFSVTMLFPKDKDLSVIKLAMKHAKIEEFGPNSKEWPDDLESPVLDGDDFPDRQGYPGNWVIKASTGEEYPPEVIDEQGDEILNAKDFYPGCFARAQVFCRVWTFGKKQGIQFMLNGVKKVGDGKPFGGRKSVKDTFAKVEDDDYESDLDGSDDSGDDSDF